MRHRSARSNSRGHVVHVVLAALALSACHDWSALSTSWEGEGVCVTYVVAGPTHTCARMSSGALYCWGDNRFGQLGVGDTTAHQAPVRVAFGALGVSKVYLPSGDGELSADTGLFTCAITTDNALWCWGSNRFGQLGTGDTELRSTPALVKGLTVDAGFPVKKFTWDPDRTVLAFVR